MKLQVFLNEAPDKDRVAGRKIILTIIKTIGEIDFIIINYSCVV